MVVDGKKIASDIISRVQKSILKLGKPVCMGIVLVGDDAASHQFVKMKEKVAKDCGIDIDIKIFSQHAKGDSVMECLLDFSRDPSVHGVVLQLPLPDSLDTNKLLSLIPIEKDVDVLTQNAIAKFRSGQLDIIPPVAAAVGEIFERENVSVHEKDVLVLGHGRLVGAPVALFMRHNDARVTVINQPVKDLALYTKEADIIISGVGVPGFITPLMIKPGVVLVDAGTSDSHGKVVGDIAPECAEQASVFTPVPGGVGPVTVAMLMKNCYRKAKSQYALAGQ